MSRDLASMPEEQRKALNRAAIELVATVGGVIRDLGEVPSGELYARCLGFMSLASYDMIIDRLMEAKLVSRDGSHMLHWIGPAKGVGGLDRESRV